MITPLHEGLVEMITLDLERTAQMLRKLFGLPIPLSGEAKVVAGDLSECVPALYRADAALLYGDGARPKLGVVAEVQLKKDPRKHETWLAYIANLRARDHCPVCLVVICPDRATARWASLPIETGHPGLTLTPLVIGPDNTPVITDVAEAIGDIGLAAVSAITHGMDPQIQTILATLTQALDTIDPSMARRYAEYVTVALTGNAHKEMERLMATETYLYQGEYAQSLLARGKAQGLAEGEAKAVLVILEVRGIAFAESDRERIASTQDLSTLERWIERAKVVDSVDQLFA
jgi:hypothetical protein